MVGTEDYDNALKALREISARIEGKVQEIGPAAAYLRLGAWRQYSATFRSLSRNMSQNRSPLGRGPGFAEIQTLLRQFDQALVGAVSAWNRLLPGEKRGRQRPL